MVITFAKYLNFTRFYEHFKKFCAIRFCSYFLETIYINGIYLQIMCFKMMYNMFIFQKFEISRTAILGPLRSLSPKLFIKSRDQNILSISKTNRTLR